MKKLIPVLLVTIVITSMFLITGCKKNEKGRSDLNVSDQDQQLQQKILANLNEYKQYKEGMLLKSGQEVPVSEAVDYIDETFNYTYCFPVTDYTRLHWDSFYIEIPLTSSGKVNKYCDVHAAYDQTVQAVRQMFLSYNEDNKRVVGLNVQDIGINPQTGKEKILLTSQILSGSGVTTPAGTDYYYAQDSYYCDGNYPPEGPYGAANYIEAQTNFVLNTAPPPGMRYYYTGSILVYFIALDYPRTVVPDNYKDYLIYYATSALVNWVPCQPSGSCTGGTKCIEGFGYEDYPQGTQMADFTEGDFYTIALKDSIITPWLQNNNPLGRSFEICRIESTETSIPNIIAQHIPKVKFSFKHTCYYDPNFPMSIE